MDVRDFFQLAAQTFPDKDCVILEDRRSTYRQMQSRIDQLAAAMRDRGVGKGTRVGILQVNSVAFVECLYAGLQIGAIVVPLNYRLKAQELEYIVNQAGLSMLFVGERYVELVQSIREKTPALTTCIGLEGPAPGMAAYETLFGGPATVAVPEPMDDHDIALILYTSGTTGLPKGAMLSYRALHHQALAMLLSLKLTHEDRVLAGGPLYHVGTLGYLIPTLYAGATWVMVPQFEARDALGTIQRERLTVCWFAPAMLNFMAQLEGASTYDLSSLRMIQYGGGPMPPRVLKDASRLFGCRFMQVYGLTEAVPQTFLDPDDHVLDEHDPRRHRLASIGKPAPNVDLRIVDAAGRDVAPGQIGEIVCQCDTMMEGYWRKPEETAQAIRDGWLHTGDLARLDADGFIYLVDRIKDMIIRGGENIYPAEIERVLYEHPAIAEAAVIGVPDETWGECVKAVVVLRPGMDATAETVIRHCQDRLASYKKPSVVEFIEALPRTSGGKVLKTELRARARAGAETSLSTPGSPS
ncbi:MAG TPA: long-chain fatty acid--CoA ligase [Caulobacteraceae bacterium]